MKVPQVSVIIPAYRRPRMLHGAIASVLGQVCTDFELIVVDDDPDLSGQGVVAAFCDERIVYVPHRKNRGAAAARNTGLAQARGQFIAFLDDDDIWHPEFLLKTVAVLCGSSSQVGVVYCKASFLPEQAVPARVLMRGDIHEQVLCGEKPTGITALVRREVFEACGNFDASLPSAQDWDLWIRVSRKYYFEPVAETLVTVRIHPQQISSGRASAIAARERILEKYAEEFAAHPRARQILLKRLGKLHALEGHWADAWKWFREALIKDPGEWTRILAWMVLEGPFQGAMIMLFSLPVLLYSQWHALRSAFVINDDVCQHIWWMRAFQDQGLFAHDLLREYAAALQPLGLVVVYRCVAVAMDPVVFTKMLPFVLFPVAVWALFRQVSLWTRDTYTAFLTVLVFMVTPVYLQHMTGGQSHAFGYTLMVLFLYFFTAEKYPAAGLVMVAGALFFPVVFVLTAGLWLLSFFFKRCGPWHGGAAFLAGLCVLAVKFVVMHDPALGAPLSRDAVMRMPELTAAGRWDVWPVAPVSAAFVHFAEQGVFLFKAGYKTFLPPAWKEALLGQHVLFFLLACLAAGWWWRRRREVSFGPIARVLVVSIILYVAAAAVVLKLYAPDRYMSYTVTLAALLFMVIPAGMSLSSWPQARVRKVLQIVAALMVLAWVPLVRDAGLKDYSQHRALYAFLRMLPQDALVAAWPDTADGIPVFARRSVLVNEEMSVPLYDRYWAQIKERTFDLLAAYYAGDRAAVTAFCRKYGVTHLVVEKDRFSPGFTGGRMYFEPFGSWIRARVKGRRHFYLNELPGPECLFADRDVCVLDVGKIL